MDVHLIGVMAASISAIQSMRTGGKFEIESADDFILDATTAITSASFTEANIAGRRRSQAPWLTTRMSVPQSEALGPPTLPRNLQPRPFKPSVYTDSRTRAAAVSPW
jgi:hypothetical protein